MGGGGKADGGKADNRVEVQVKSDSSPGEVSIQVSPDATLQEVKEVLAATLKRSDILADGVDFVKFLPNGEAVVLTGKSKLGARRTLCIRGCANLGFTAKEAGVKSATGSLNDFDQADPYAEISSPRSLQACAIEGVLPEELRYSPIEHFEQPGLPPRIASMRHDFFEAYRQDVLEMARQSRVTLLDEEYESKGGQLSPNQSTMSLTAGSITATGGIWGGALAEASYPTVRSFFDAVNAACACPRGGRLFEDALKLPGDAGEVAAHKPDRWAPPAPKPFQKIMAGNDLLRLSGSTFYGSPKPDANREADYVQAMVHGLRRLPYGRRKGEQLAGVIHRTESVVVVQREQDAKRLDRQHREIKTMAKRMVCLAEAQKEAMEARRMEEWEKRKQIDEAHEKNRGEWSKGVQKENYNKAAKRAEVWAARRQHIADSALKAEAERNATFLRTTFKECAVKKDNTNLRDLQRSCYARRWLDRRSRWAKSAKEVRQTVKSWETALGTRRAQSDARVEDQKLRIMTWTEVVREVKALRKDFQDMVRERELRRRAFRGEAISNELKEIADENEAAESAAASTMDCGGTWRGDSSFSMGLTTGSFGGGRTRPAPLGSIGSSPSSSGQLSSSPFRLPTKGPRFDFPRVANDMLSPLALTYSLTELSHSVSLPEIRGA
eukprot:TRINITY_DN46720_c0_g1_i1.p1 TRINITY_DN46720_c0_g1~~TRINITY_DN46720_c0_g1_i1.p1  ORF type:complete len:666 (-),score=159.65 TRINITY_DN46720_c0_g1_i1:84-2081(-)